VNRLKIVGLSVLGLGLLGSLLLAVIAARGSTWEGRTVQTWVEDFRLGGGEGHKRAVKAIRSMGTNAIPDLVHLLRTEDSDFKLAVRALPSRFLPRSILTLPSVHHWRAQTGLEAVGGPAVPALLGLLGNTNVNLEWRARDVLVSIGEDGVPMLQQALTNENRKLFLQAAQTLGSLRKDAAAAIPALSLLLNDDDDRIRTAAADALKQIDPDIAIQAGLESTQSPQRLISQPRSAPLNSKSRRRITSSQSDRE
jgi:HEAT repeat protein